MQRQLPISARLAAWGSAAMTGAISLDDAADAVADQSDVPHRVFGLDRQQGGVNLAYALGRLRADGARGLRLVLPAPGDVSGLPGPPAFNERALMRGEAVVTVGGPPRALLTEGRGGWRRYDVAADARTPLSLADAEREVARVTRAATEVLVALNVARWEPAAADVLAHLSGAQRPELPLGLAPRALHVLETAARLRAVVELARCSDGAAVTAEEMRSRADVLRDLDAAARRGIEAACSGDGHLGR